MVFLALAWAVISGACIALGIEHSLKWRDIYGFGIAESTRKVIFMGGLGASFILLIFSFSYFVAKNGIVVLIVLIVTFAIMRILIETLKRNNPYSRNRKHDHEYEGNISIHSVHNAPLRKNSKEIKETSIVESSEDASGQDDQVEGPSYQEIFERINSGGKK